MRPLPVLLALLLLSLGLWLAYRALPSGGAVAPGGEPQAAEADDPPPAALPGLAAGSSPSERRSAEPTPAAEAGREPGEAAGPPPSPPAADIALTGRVVDSASREPLPGFRLQVRGAAGELELETDAEGRFETGTIWSPGELRFWHLPDPSAEPGDPYESAWDLVPWNPELPAEAAATGRWTVTLLAERPAFTLEVRTERPGGAPVPGAEVFLVHGWRDAGGGFHSEWIDELTTGPDGRARFGLFGEEARGDSLRLLARHVGGELASASLFLDPPLQRGPWTLTLLPTGGIRARVLDRGGAPVDEGSVLVVSAEVVQRAMGVTHAPVVAGEAVVSGLGPGRYEVRAREPDTGDRRAAVVEVAAGVEVPVELSFADGATALAVAGRVVDVKADRYEPEERRVPFGTDDLVFRRVRELPLRTLVFELVDARTGEPLTHVEGEVYVHRGRPRAEGGWGWQSASDGRAELQVADRDDLLWRVRVRDFADGTGRVPPLGEPGADGPIRVALRPGFEHELQVVDARTAEPLSATSFTGPGGAELGRTDTRGSVRLAAHAWPGPLRVARAGYRDRLLAPEAFEFVSGVVALEPLD